MSLVQISVSEDQMVTLRDIVTGMMREAIEELRGVALEGVNELYRPTGEEAAQKFFQATLGLLESDLAGLLRLFLVEEPEEALPAPEGVSGETVEETD